LGLEDGHQAGRENLAGDLELLIHVCLDALRVRALDERPLLRAEDALLTTAREQDVEAGHRLHQLDTVLLRREPLVDLEERHDALLLPQVLRSALPFHLAVHRVLEEDRTDDAAVERRTRHDARAHLVDPVEHLRFIAVGILAHAVRLQSLRRAAPALVAHGDEAVAFADLLDHLLVHTLLLCDTTFSIRPRASDVLTSCVSGTLPLFTAPDARAPEHRRRRRSLLRLPSRGTVRSRPRRAARAGRARPPRVASSLHRSGGPRCDGRRP